MDATHEGLWDWRVPAVKSSTAPGLFSGCWSCEASRFTGDVRSLFSSTCSILTSVNPYRAASTNGRSIRDITGSRFRLRDREGASSLDTLSRPGGGTRLHRGGRHAGDRHPHRHHRDDDARGSSLRESERGATAS
jgi:hypothetical protein